MVRCKTCGHLKSLHSTDGKCCRATVRERESDYSCTYHCDCSHFYPEPYKPKKTWTKLEIEKAIQSSSLGTLIDKEKLEKELFTRDGEDIT